MKIIDLLNKIANGEIPKRIIYDDKQWEYDDKLQDYITFDDSRIDWHYTIMDYINDEIEILEEESRDINVCGSWFTKSEYDKLAQSEKEKKIPEKLNVIAYEKCVHEVTHKEKQLALEIRETQIAFNEIIDYLKSKGE